MPAPGPHPHQQAGSASPPDDFDSIELPLVSKSVHASTRKIAGGPWFRLHATGHGALHFGRTHTYRFDDPKGKFGVLYAGTDEYCAFIETFGQVLGPPLPAAGLRYVTDGDLERRDLARIRTSSKLRLVDLTGAGLARVGADARLCSGDYRVAQKWSRAIHEHPSRPDGLVYPARRDPSRAAVAIFDRARPRLVSTALGTLMTPRNRPIRDGILSTYGLGLLITK